MTDTGPDRSGLPFSRWWLVALGAVAMGMAGTYQFVWSSIRGPLGTQIGATETTLGTLFTLLIAMQTLAQFPAGWVRDRYGPRIPMLIGAGGLAAGYLGLALAPSTVVAAGSVALGGIGAGAVYTVAVNTPVKWFDERRGLATGVVTMAYSGLSIAFIPVVRGAGQAAFAGTMVGFAVLIGVSCLLAGLVLRDPPTRERTGEDAEISNPDGAPDAYGWRKAIRTWQFWVLYGAFALVNGVGLMLIGKVIDFATSLGLTAATGTAAASMIAVADGGGVIVGGGLSDRLGPERTAGVSLLLSALGIVAATVVGANGMGFGFVGLVGVAAFFRSPVFAIFPGIVGSYYGTAHSSENYALMYSAKLWGSVFGGAVTSVLIAAIGWQESFLLGACLLAVAGIGTLVVRPVRRA